ncbi:MAG TPA: hypothetical protein VH475_07510 [Tepidisphaeraceae bacterium]|jgi:hypothetical protein
MNVRYLAAGLLLWIGLQAARAQTLYNGIELSDSWPPRLNELSRDPMPVPYLAHPPRVIPIDIGRQLLVDDFLIEKAVGLTRTFHEAQWYAHNPVLAPDRPSDRTGSSPTAMVFSDGVWFDPRDRLFKMWYMAGYGVSTGYATSRDGVHWDKPALDVRPGTNLVDLAQRDSSTVWLDLLDPDPARRFKMFRVGKGWICNIYFSRDGVHFGEPVAQAGPGGDRSTVFYNPFRNVWVYSIRTSHNKQRVRRYHEGRDVLEAAHWKTAEPTFWVGADDLDPRRADLNTPCELYNLDAVAYESILLGAFTIWRGQPKDRAKPNDVVLAFSRDGFHWDRANRNPLIGPSERQGDWNWANVQSAGGVCLVVGDRLYFYCSGRAGKPGTPESGVSSTGLAFLRRDGFASMDAAGETEATLTTRLLTFKGSHLFVNADANGGELRAELLDEAGRPIEPFTRARSTTIRADQTLHEITWTGGDLSKYANRPVRLRFFLRDAKLYAFWITPDASGASHGYVAAGGPGFDGPIDVVGPAGAAAAADVLSPEAK